MYKYCPYNEHQFFHQGGQSAAAASRIRAAITYLGTHYNILLLFVAGISRNTGGQARTCGLSGRASSLAGKHYSLIIGIYRSPLLLSQ